MELLGPLPVITLTWECQVVFEAVDPDTGALVSGVIIDNPVMYGYNLTVEGSQAGVNIIPLLTPVSLEDQAILVGTSPDTLGSGA